MSKRHQPEIAYIPVISAAHKKLVNGFANGYTRP